MPTHDVEEKHNMEMELIKSKIDCKTKKQLKTKTTHTKN